MTHYLGQQLGNYRLISRLGEGGFAEVYLGEHIHLGTQAAIKVLHTQLISSDVEQFRIEARTIARLEHPHIVRVLDFGVEGKTPFLVMGYAPNGTLRQRHPKGTLLSPTTIASYLKQVADALQYAHNEKLIHRDIKPENMLLGRRNEVLLSDFGIALVAQSSRYQNSQDIIGTVAYMAPEQLQGKPRLASDQYSLGIVVYEWLSGDRPFHGSFTEIYSQHMFVPPPPLHERFSTISPEIETVVLKALAKNPQQRFLSVQAFATAFEQASQSARSRPTRQGSPPPASQKLQPTIIPPPANQLLHPTQLAGPGSHRINQTEIANQPSRIQRTNPVSTSQNRPRLPGQQFSRRAVVAGLIALVTIGGGAAIWRGFTSSSDLHTNSTPSSGIPVGNLPPRGTKLYTYTGHSSYINSVAWSPKGQRVASGSADKTVQVWDATTGNNVYTYTGHSDTVYAVSWSPDGKYIASGSYDHTMQVWNATSGSNAYTFTDPRQGHIYAVAWSPDGKYIAFQTNAGVQIWNATTGNIVYTYTGHSLAVYTLAWSPNGQRVASGSTDNTVQIWDATTGNNVYTYTGHLSEVDAVSWSPDGKFIASGGRDETIRIWNATTGANIYTYKGPFAEVDAVAWSPKGRYVAFGGGYHNDANYDHTVHIWDATLGTNIYTYQGLSSAVDTVAWSPDGQRIAAGSADNTVQVWEAM